MKTSSRVKRYSLKKGIAALIHAIMNPRWMSGRTCLMRPFSPIALAALILAGMMQFSLQADDYLKNADFKEGSQCWRGDGQAAFLKPDGTEGAEGDKDVIPVIKIALSRVMPRAVFQNFVTKDAPGTLSIKVQVYASSDFKRSTHAEDYNADDYMPITDFMIRLLPDFRMRRFDLKPGDWVSLTCPVISPTPADDRTVYFVAPPGEGTVYIKNPSVTK